VAALPQVHPLRFIDVTAAIKAMARRFPSRQLPAEWAKVIQQKPQSPGTWEEIFAQHTDLFRVRDDGCIVLRDRHHLPPFFHVITKAVVTQAEYVALSDEAKKDYDRPPLTDEQVDDVVAAAGVGHERLLAAAKERRESFQAWVSMGVGAVTSLGGVVLGHFLKTPG
jgi:hypothetical protein